MSSHGAYHLAPPQLEGTNSSLYGIWGSMDLPMIEYFAMLRIISRIKAIVLLLE
jgi:hypothetical protein